MMWMWWQMRPNWTRPPAAKANTNLELKKRAHDGRVFVLPPGLGGRTERDFNAAHMLC